MQYLTHRLKGAVARFRVTELMVFEARGTFVEEASTQYAWGISEFPQILEIGMENCLEDKQPLS